MPKSLGLLKQVVGNIDQSQVNTLCAVAVALFVFLQLRSLLGTRNARRNPADLALLDPSTPSKPPMVDKQVGDDDYISTDYEWRATVEQVPYRAISVSDDEALMKSQLFYEKMKKRRSVRQFGDRPVPAKLILNLIKTAATAPSGANMQPWTFCVIGSEQMKTRIRELVEAEERRSYRRRIGVKWATDIAHLDMHWSKPYLSEAPFILAVMEKKYELDAEGAPIPPYHSELSVNIAVGLLIAAVQNAGLVSVVATPLSSGEAIRKLLKRPANERVNVLLPLGFAAEEAMVPDFKRKVVEDIVRFY